MASSHCAKCFVASSAQTRLLALHDDLLEGRLAEHGGHAGTGAGGVRRSLTEEAFPGMCKRRTY